MEGSDEDSDLRAAPFKKARREDKDEQVKGIRDAVKKAKPQPQDHQDAANTCPEQTPPQAQTSKPGSSYVHGFDFTKTASVSDVLKSLRAQMDTGFNRRSEAFLQAIFDKHKTPGGTNQGLSQRGLMSALADAGIHISAGEAEELHRTQDLNGNRCIDHSEFLSIVSTRVGGVAHWASTLPLAELLADCMPIQNEADPVRAVSKLSEIAVKNIVACYTVQRGPRSIAPREN
jgi:hypothetical protein